MQASTLIAFDVGLRRTGVAIGQSLTQSTQAAGQVSVHRGQHDWQHIDKLIQQWQPDKAIIGNPNTNDPHLNKAINRLRHHLASQHTLPISLIDETLTSHSANALLLEHDLSTEKKTQLRDQIAACLILESYFNDRTDT